MPSFLKINNRFVKEIVVDTLNGMVSVAVWRAFPREIRAILKKTTQRRAVERMRHSNFPV